MSKFKFGIQVFHAFQHQQVGAQCHES